MKIYQKYHLIDMQKGYDLCIVKEKRGRIGIQNKKH